MKISAGFLMFRIQGGLPELFLVHPGGPFFKNKDEGFWTIPKGETNQGEDLLDTAKREFFEETGIKAIEPFIALGQVKQKGGKVVHAWAFEYNFTGEIISNTFPIEWPPRSGKSTLFPEIDKGQYFKPKQALLKINQAQMEYINRLLLRLDQKL